eukprot:TRINITY_DN14731_c0_g1_i1.p1 TRINITY_DN14731_c0_g1~~TRINITY_DN14731_c0_g1_i1.p1  ORF type:complete len:784 (-),score=124.44 TRINITY_DN14731_c0_g1_i1:54-2210(-)
MCARTGDGNLAREVKTHMDRLGVAASTKDYQLLLSSSLGRGKGKEDGNISQATEVVKQAILQANAVTESTQENLAIGHLLVDLLNWIYSSSYPLSARLLWSHYLLKSYFGDIPVVKEYLDSSGAQTIANITLPLKSKFKLDTLPELADRSTLTLDSDYSSLLKLFVTQLRLTGSDANRSSKISKKSLAAAKAASSGVPNLTPLLELLSDDTPTEVLFLACKELIQKLIDNSEAVFARDIIYTFATHLTSEEQIGLSVRLLRHYAQKGLPMESTLFLQTMADDYGMPIVPKLHELAFYAFVRSTPQPSPEDIMTAITSLNQYMSPSTMVHNHVLSALLRKGNSDKNALPEVRAYVLWMNKQGIYMDEATYAIVMSAYLSAGDVAEGTEWLKKTIRDGKTSTQLFTTYFQLLVVSLEKSKFYTQSLECEDIRGNLAQKAKRAALLNEVSSTYKSRRHLIFFAIREMSKAKVTADFVCYKMMLRAFSCFRMWNDILRLYEKTRKLYFTTSCLNTVMKAAFMKENTELTNKIFFRLLRNVYTCPPEQLNSYSNIPSLNKETRDQMISDSLFPIPDIDTVNIYLASLTRAAALQFIYYFKNSPLKLYLRFNTKTYNILLRKITTKNQKWTGLPDLIIQKMLQETKNCPPYKATSAEVEQYDSLFFIISSMFKDRVSPDHRTMTLLERIDPLVIGPMRATDLEQCKERFKTQLKNKRLKNAEKE